ncbi:hypothetical protein [Paraburkholderia sp. UCT31]|uniref:hypothetical protein n=1 Tax=Paraburkholderia sp. UCT31 TaxID=2615209 RepID=UPI0016551D39|nr:hypothetical protein [Paraburkholderia sp. UCT31]
MLYSQLMAQIESLVLALLHFANEALTRFGAAPLLLDSVMFSVPAIGMLVTTLGYLSARFYSAFTLGRLLPTPEHRDTLLRVRERLLPGLKLLLVASAVMALLYCVQLFSWALAPATGQLAWFPTAVAWVVGALWLLIVVVYAVYVADWLDASCDLDSLREYQSNRWVMDELMQTRVAKKLPEDAKVISLRWYNSETFTSRVEFWHEETGLIINATGTAPEKGWMRCSRFGSGLSAVNEERTGCAIVKPLAFLDGKFNLDEIKAKIREKERSGCSRLMEVRVVVPAELAEHREELVEAFAHLSPFLDIEDARAPCPSDEASNLE